MEEGAAVAAEAGFHAIAWTVRPGAHMEPERVERELPKARGHNPLYLGYPHGKILTVTTHRNTPAIQSSYKTIYSKKM